MRYIFSLSLFCLALWTLQAQSALRGQVQDAKTKEALFGAVISLEGQNQAQATDFEGLFEFPELPAGTYTLNAELMGYKAQSQSIELVAGQGLDLTIKLLEEGVEVETVVVQAKAFTHTEQALLLRQKNAVAVVDGISAAQFRKTGDNDAASAMRRVTGLSVEKGKYVYVRGLSDRYSKATLNGAEIPGLDPNRNTVQMDLFPTQALDNILVYKTFTPDLYGDFSGGYIDLQTKDFPDRFQFSAQASVGHNSLATWQGDKLGLERRRGDFWAQGAEARALPELVAANRGAIPNYQDNNPASGELLSRLSRSFENNWALENRPAPLNHRISLSAGNQQQVFGNPLGWMAAFSHQQEYNAYTGGQYGIYELTEFMSQARSLTPQLELSDARSQREVLWGGLLSAHYALGAKHRLGLIVSHNQAGNSSSRYLQGRKQRDDPDDIFQTRTLSYEQRRLSSLQLKGSHRGDWGQLQWQSALSRSAQDEPDIRYFTNRYLPDLDLYFIKPSSDRIPSRFYRHLDELNWSSKLDYSKSLATASGRDIKLKTGLSYLYKARNFNEERYSFVGQNTRYQGDIAAYFAPENALGWDANEQTYANQGRGLYLLDNLDPANTYQAWQDVAGAYLMGEWPLSAKTMLVGGLRGEYTNMRLLSRSEVVQQRYPGTDGSQPLLQNLDLLPSLNLIYSPKEQSKLRLAYSRTLARPSFRELAPFASFDVEGGYILVGNPDLRRSLVDNFDCRYELYPRSGEVFSVAGFFKRFQNPIERTYNPEQPNGEFTFRNVSSAWLAGAEFELRKQLESLHPKLSPWSVALNFAYIYSQTQIDERELAQIRANDPEAAATRAMFGQSPYTLNALLSYKNNKGTQANLSFNVVGKRIAYITIGASPEIYELPRPWLNFNLSQKIGERLELNLSANNLLMTQYREVMFFKEQVYDTQRYGLGLMTSLGLRYNL